MTRVRGGAGCTNWYASHSAARAISASGTATTRRSRSEISPGLVSPEGDFHRIFLIAVVYPPLRGNLWSRHERNQENRLHRRRQHGQPHGGPPGEEGLRRNRLRH